MGNHVNLFLSTFHCVSVCILNNRASDLAHCPLPGGTLPEADVLSDDQVEMGRLSSSGMDSDPKVRVGVFSLRR